MWRETKQILCSQQQLSPLITCNYSKPVNWDNIHNGLYILINVRLVFFSLFWVEKPTPQLWFRDGNLYSDHRQTETENKPNKKESALRVTDAAPKVSTRVHERTSSPIRHRQTTTTKIKEHKLQEEPTNRRRKQIAWITKGWRRAMVGIQNRTTIDNRTAKGLLGYSLLVVCKQNRSCCHFSLRIFLTIQDTTINSSRSKPKYQFLSSVSFSTRMGCS